MMVDLKRNAIDVLSQPKGIIKVILVFLAILAFSTTSGFTSITNVSFKVVDKTCQNKALNYSITVSYPFRISETPVFPNDYCSEKKFNFYGDFSSAAIFYVFTGSIVFIYLLVALGLYTYYFEELEEKYFKIELFIAAAIGILWFIATVAWASNVTDFKYYTSANRLFHKYKDNGIEATITDSSTYGGLNVSLIFGFANVALWIASLWFIYKDTPFYVGRGGDMEPTVAPEGSQM